MFAVNETNELVRRCGGQIDVSVDLRRVSTTLRVPLHSRKTSAICPTMAMRDEKMRNMKCTTRMTTRWVTSHYSTLCDANACEQACYVFEPRHASIRAPNERPAKRRKTSKAAKDVQEEDNLFQKLLQGQEESNHAGFREGFYQGLWSNQEEKLQRIVNHVNKDALNKVSRFLKQEVRSGARNRIPTALVLTGPNGNQSQLLEHWRGKGTPRAAEEIVSLDPSQMSSLTAVLKSVIKAAIVQKRELEAYTEFLAEHKKLLPMNYDLEILQLFVEREGIEKLVIAILDVETSDITVLGELVNAISSWTDRIPIVLLFGVATTLELFESRLPRAVFQHLDAEVFDVSPSEDGVYKLYQCVQDDETARLWLGPAISSLLLERSKDQDDTTENFVRSIRYVFMSHMFANPLTRLFQIEGTIDALGPLVCEAVRNTSSFRNHAETLLDHKEHKTVKRLLEDDKHLSQEVRKAIKQGQGAMHVQRKAIQYFSKLYEAIPRRTESFLSPFELDVQMSAGPTFLDSQLFDATLASLQRLPSDKLVALLTDIPLPNLIDKFPLATAIKDLKKFQKASKGTSTRSAYDPSHNTTSTTISRQNTVSLAKHAPKVTKEEQAYTDLVDKLQEGLQEYFESALIDPTKLFMHEVFIYGLKMPLATALAPRPRYCIERALDHPGDYLGCECCTSAGDGARSGRQPPTSLLWQLWCEAGNIVNVRDLWEAFSAATVTRADDEDDEDEEGSGQDGIDERMALALFYKGLAELKMLGFIKPTKRKVDCLAKTTWRGL